MTCVWTCSCPCYALLSLRLCYVMLQPRSGITGAGNDYQKELQFKKLNAQKDVIEVKVLRSGEEQLVTNSDVVVVSCVGDVHNINTRVLAHLDRSACNAYVRLSS